MLLASIVIPLLKLFALFTVILLTGLRVKQGKLLRTWLYRFVDTIGRWAMLDVFVLAIWVGLVKLNTLGKVTPGAGALPFALVVVLTLLASMLFDPQVIWDQETTTS